MSTVTILLAAGKGMRLGGPKALLVFPGAPGARPLPLAIAHAEARLAAESSRVVVVARKPIVQALIAFVRPGLDLVVSDAAEELGPAGSIATAVTRLDADDRVIVCPVDTLPARAATVAALLAGLGEAGAPPLATRPRHGGRTGHPIAIQAKALDRYRSPTPPPLRDHLHGLGDAVRDIDVDDPDVLVDIDTPADAMRRLRAPLTFFGDVK